MQWSVVFYMISRNDNIFQNVQIFPKKNYELRFLVEIKCVKLVEIKSAEFSCIA